jgi:hypothetical protein
MGWVLGGPVRLERLARCTAWPLDRRVHVMTNLNRSPSPGVSAVELFLRKSDESE